MLRFINLYTEPPLQVLSLKIPSMALTVFVFASLLLTYIPSVSVCIVNVRDFVSLLPAILVISSNFSITAIYVFCLINRKFIIESVDGLDEYVRQSINEIQLNWSFFNFQRPKSSILLPVICCFAQGINQRSKSTTFYESQHNRIKVFSQRALHFGIGVSSVLSISSLLGPLFYALFGAPEPSTWKLPVDVV